MDAGIEWTRPNRMTRFVYKILAFFMKFGHKTFIQCLATLKCYSMPWVRI